MTADGRLAGHTVLEAIERKKCVKNIIELNVLRMHALLYTAINRQFAKISYYQWETILFNPLFFR